MRFKCLCVLILGLSAMVLGASEGRAGEPQDVFAGDKRLSRPVTLEARHLPLDEVLAQTSELTGVAVKAEGDAADLRATGVLSNIPLEQFLKRLAALVQLTWRASPGGDAQSREYVLFFSKKDREAVEGEKAASWARFREHFKRLIRAAAQPNSLGNSMLDGATRRHASHHVIGSGARVLAALPESFLDTALRTGRATIPVRSLSPVQQRAIVEYQRVAHGARVAIHHEFAPHRAEKGEPEPPVPAAPGPAEEAFVMVSVGGPQGDGEEAPIGVGVFDPRSGLNHGIGFGPFSLTGDELLQIPRHFDSRRCTLSRPGDLQLPPFGLLWEDALIQFARLNGVSVLSDAFDPDYARHGEWSFPPGTMPEQILDRFCIPYKYTWNASEELVLFRQKQWPFSRERQIPERLARRWRQMARESGEYPLAELAGMAAMHPEQRRMLHRYAGNEAQVAAGVPQFAEVLLLFGALTPAQQGAAEKGLTVDQFDLAQQKLLAPVVARLRPDARGLSQSLRQLSITSSPGKPAAVLTLLFRDGERRTATIDRRATPSPDPWAIRRGATGLRAAP